MHSWFLTQRSYTLHNLSSRQRRSYLECLYAVLSKTINEFKCSLMYKYLISNEPLVFRTFQIKTNSKTQFYIEFHSACLEGKLRTKPLLIK